MKRFALLYLGCVTGLLLLASCMGTAPDREVRLIDSLNQVAYALRYKELEASRQAAEQAYHSVHLYKSGKAEACNHLGFCAFMRMDFERAVKWHKAVYRLTKNELELLVADIGLMKVCQRTAMNKEFYDYRNSALRRMKRIGEDDGLFVDRHERQRLEYARSEFHIVSAIYYYYLQQQPEAVACMHSLSDAAWQADTAQWLYAHYVRGSADLMEGGHTDDRLLSRFDELYDTWRLAQRQGFLYFEGNSVQGLANLMTMPAAYQYLAEGRPHLMGQLGYPVDSLLPLRLGQLALQKFRAYDDLYQIAGTYVTIGKYLNMHGRYAEALDTLQRALACVNTHHSRYYQCLDTLDRLKPFGRPDTLSTERRWMEQKLMTVPEWISRIREQLSVSYAGLGMKEPSDYNRNIYLDILDDTRQDKELESRYQALELESRQLNWLLALVLLGIVLVVGLFGFFNRRSKLRHRQHLRRLKLLLDVCQQITSSIPSDAQSEEDIIESIRQTVANGLEQLFGEGRVSLDEKGRLYFPHGANKEERAMEQVIAPYLQWALENGMTSVSLVDERRRLEKLRYVYEQHIAGNKRQNLLKKACLAIVNGITPYIDRMLNEVRKLTAKGYLNNAVIKQEKYQYIDELVSTINDYNDILARWIKMKQGTLSLHVETFALNELFDLIRKGSRAFEMKQQCLEVEPTDACVKADRALTLFMINTLAENARKYTPQGGTVRIYARAAEQYVEVSVEDNGRGLSPEDIACLLGEKVYDSQRIGLKDAVDSEELLGNKGSGFGLMNCKGIIEKYRKSNPLFQVCLFSVESRLGEGSRFFFRLPQGMRKVMTGLLLLLTVFTSSCGSGGEAAPLRGEAAADTLLSADFEQWLDIASDYANAAYYANVEGDYEATILYADSAIAYLNEHYARFSLSPRRYMSLWNEEEGRPAELEWWDEPFNSDFHVILDIRNEAAVAFLALKQWEAYAYNNDAYTILYKLLGEDQSLEEYCFRLERSTNNKMVGILLALFLLVALLMGFYLLYFRKRLVYRWNLEQVLEINRQVSAASWPEVSDHTDALLLEEATWRGIPRRIVSEVFGAVDELWSIERLGIAVSNDADHRLEFSFYPPLTSDDEQRWWSERGGCCYEEHTQLTESERLLHPLVVEVGGVSRCVGILCIESRYPRRQEGDRLLLELIANYMAIVVYNAVVKLATKYRDIETAQDEARRASWEESQLHVQNMVLDNCLSTIKHETVYYPNRIKQLIGRVRAGRLTELEERETVEAIGELIEYYKGVFTILSSCAARQLEEVTFRRTTVAVTHLTDYACKYLQKAGRGKMKVPCLQVHPIDARVIGDLNLLQFLLENLLDEALAVEQEGTLLLDAVIDNGFVRFRFTDRRRFKSQEELNRLFYPDRERMTVDGEDALAGTEYLVCKQIIRDHDEFAGRRGCRINAEEAEGGGFTVYFTLPAG